MAETPYALEISPESALQFTLTRSTPNDGRSSADATPRCTMILRHPGLTKEHLAFKVKTTQPRRYLVRPNQGVVAPGTSEKVTILLVEKDKQVLLQSYDRLGQSALDHSKDKFLVQSCAAPDDFALRYMSAKAKVVDGPDGRASKELIESLTTMWNSAASGSIPIFNKKLHVRHVVAAAEGAASKGTSGAPQPLEEKPNMENMSPEQMFTEVASLRRKYDELVAFSVNLTAERDILNNTLEQTKRDLHRESAAKAALESKVPGAYSNTPKQSSGGMSLSVVICIALICFLLGIKASTSGVADIIADIPVLGGVLGLVLGDDVDIAPGAQTEL